ncbi:MAG TPA: hypothetical protein VFL83_16975 [Anaeromyxobacter sp.]|nr:hypothetical protein [Anaeromyxobacter sp.]
MQKTVAGALMLALALAPGAAFAKGEKEHGRGKEKKNPFASIPVSGTSSAGAFNGTMDVVGWQQNTSGGIDAIGILNGTLAGMPVHDQVITWPLAIPGAPRASQVRAQQACDILNLVLGPLDLNLLGLEVHLNQVVLDIVAQTGAGNLLGNLLCAVVGLLDGLAIGPILVQLLNQLTTLLGGLGL